MDILLLFPPTVCWMDYYKYHNGYSGEESDIVTDMTGLHIVGPQQMSDATLILFWKNRFMTPTSLCSYRNAMKYHPQRRQVQYHASLQELNKC